MDLTLWIILALAVIAAAVAFKPHATIQLLRAVGNCAIVCIVAAAVAYVMPTYLEEIRKRQEHDRWHDERGGEE